MTPLLSPAPILLEIPLHGWREAAHEEMAAWVRKNPQWRRIGPLLASLAGFYFTVEV